MSGAVYFANPSAPSPVGKFFYAGPGGEYVEGPCLAAIAGRVAGILEAHGIHMTAEEAVASYMCPRIPGADWFCRGQVDAPRTVRPDEAMRNSAPYTSRRVVTFDVISERVRRCASCPQHVREWCPTCTGHIDRILLLFGGRRPPLPEDRGTGVCRCAAAYEAAIASVEYGKDEPVWKGAPGSCWRHGDV